jgi:hypothetical protein
VSETPHVKVGVVGGESVAGVQLLHELPKSNIKVDTAVVAHLRGDAVLGGRGGVHTGHAAYVVRGALADDAIAVIAGDPDVGELHDPLPGRSKAAVAVRLDVQDQVTVVDRGK